ncbi:MAG: hypothetical protein FRX48_03624 [Lasallia pustulata]|uniref:Uncharacterized protein n=1 Tax=Lasallia pustulata TaxID=136370 RepID=A0A5M8PUC8_9LECA|nr:MAG: hypothetical protein FRX48_03624 [Lasallia pustulata]
MAICEQCCIASGGQDTDPFCQSGASDNLLFCADPTGAGLAPNDNCLVYKSLTYDATALFPSTIEAFVNQIPLPTGIIFSAQASGSGSSGSTTGALSASSLNSQAASFTGTTVPTTAKSTARIATVSPQSTAAASSATASSAGATSAASGTPAPATATAKPNAGSRGFGGRRGAVLDLAVALGLIAAL